MQSNSGNDDGDCDHYNPTTRAPWTDATKLPPRVVLPTPHITKSSSLSTYYCVSSSGLVRSRERQLVVGNQSRIVLPRLRVSRLNFTPFGTLSCWQWSTIKTCPFSKQASGILHAMPGDTTDAPHGPNTKRTAHILGIQCCCEAPAEALLSIPREAIGCFNLLL